MDLREKVTVSCRRSDQRSKLAKTIMTQYGGPNGELAAALRYLSQRYTMPTGKAKGLLTDIGTEELAHLEMVATIIYQLSQDADGEDFYNATAAAPYAKWDKGIHQMIPELSHLPRPISTRWEQTTSLTSMKT